MRRVTPTDLLSMVLLKLLELLYLFRIAGVIFVLI